MSVGAIKIVPYILLKNYLKQSNLYKCHKRKKNVLISVLVIFCSLVYLIFTNLVIKIIIINILNTHFFW